MQIQEGTYYMWCLSQGFYSCTNIMTKKQVGEERVYSAFTSTVVHHQRKSGLELKAGQEAGADVETREGCSLLDCFPCLAQLAFL